jgi:dTMP kinase
MGLFITFEGVEGAGKTTQMDLVEARLKAAGLPVFRTREPGGTVIGEQIRSVLLARQSAGMDPLAELFLIEAARAQLVAERIRPEIEAGSVVLCDRFTDATLAYQGYGRCMDVALIEELNELATAGLRPDLTLLLDCPIETGLERIRRRPSGTSCGEGGPDRLEAESRGFHERVRQGYLRLAAADPVRIRVVDGVGGVEEVQERVFEHIQKLIEKPEAACRLRRSSDRTGRSGS